MLDAAFLLSSGLGAHPRAPVEPAARVALTLEALVAPEQPLPPGTRWTASVFLERREKSRQGDVERHFQLVKEVAGEALAVSIPGLLAGNYWVVGHAPGLARATAQVSLHHDETVRLVFEPAAALSVKVLAQHEEDLTPLPGATVLVGAADELCQGAQTDDKGEARFQAVAVGPQRVRIFAPGYEPYEGMAERELLVRLRPVSTLRVTVTDEGVVQPDARVYIAGVQLWPARVVLTAQHGRVDITGIKAGRYALYAEKGAKISALAPDVEVLSRTGFVDVTLELKPGYFATAQVISRETEKPVVGARVTWSSAGLGQFSRHQLSAEDGIVRMGPLSTLEGVLSIRASGFVSRVVPVEQPGEREEGAEHQIIRLERSGTIEGRVIDEDGFPVQGATVEVAGTDMFGMPVSVTYRSDEISDAHFDWAEDVKNILIPAGELGVMLGPVPPIPLSDVQPSEGRRLTTDEKGYFLVRDVPPGEIVVLARHPAHMDGKSPVLKLAPGGHKKTEIVLGKGQPLRGRVMDHVGFPVANARVRISARGFDRRVTAESDGTFSLPAAPEDVTLRVSQLERPLRVIFSRKVDKKERHEEIKVELPEPRGESLLVVADAEGTPVELAQVALISLDRSVPFTSTRFTNKEGQVRFEEAVGLKARLEVSAPGYVTLKRERTLKGENKVLLTQALTARGRVMGVRGRLPAGGARVTFRGAGVLRTVVTDELGEYRLTGLPPGTADFDAVHEEYGTGKLRTRLALRAGQDEVELPDLIVSPMLEVSGQVVGLGGGPLAGALVSGSRLSPYLPAGGTAEVLATSDAEGRFTLNVGRDEPLYLYGALPGRAYGFSDAISFGDRDRVDGVRVIIDRRDKLPPHELGTVLIALEPSPAGLLVYAVAEGSQAARAGILPDDLVVEIDDTVPHDVSDARELLSGLPGSDLRVLIRRAGSQLEVLTSREAFLR